MKINFLGTCAGTEPMPSRRHTSFCIEEDGRVYWFDAGECCSRTAHLMGIDLLKVSDIFVSHSHIDHIGGLSNLLWHMKKISMVKDKPFQFGKTNLFLPDIEVMDGVNIILKTTLADYGEKLDVNPKEITDGILLDDGILKVTALHNHHLKVHDFAPWRSFSFKIESKDKTVIYSGDLGDYSDIDELLQCGADALIIETGHLKIDGVYEYCKDKNIARIFFFHNGREILNNPEAAEEKVNRLFKGKAVITADAMIAQI